MLLRGGHTTDDSRLGRVAPTDWSHVEKYPLRGLDSAERPKGVPVGTGINWYEGFYPENLVWRKRANSRISDWWVDEKKLGRIAGGHAIALEPFDSMRDLDTWWAWHNQVSEGICVSEMIVRVGALLNRKRYQPRPVYDVAQTLDEWAGEDYEGTSANAGFKVYRDMGLVPAKTNEAQVLNKHGITRPFVASEGILATRWARTDADVFEALGRPDAEYAIWLNSWGSHDYPHRVFVPRSVITRLLSEDGEFGIPTDR